MPQLSRFFGIIISMYFQDHNPPHFQAAYNEFKCVIDIETLEITKGDLPPRAYKMVAEWASLHIEELLENWQEAQSTGNFKKIEPLK